MRYCWYQVYIYGVCFQHVYLVFRFTNFPSKGLEGIQAQNIIVITYAFSGMYNTISTPCCSIENEYGNCVQCVNDAFFINTYCGNQGYVRDITYQISVL